MTTYQRFLLLILLFLPVSALAAGFERDLYFGLKNSPDIKSLQEFLQGQGLYSGPVNGNFFSLTREAVKKFQQKEGITPAAGYFGTRTQARVNTILGVVGARTIPVVSPKVTQPVVTRELILVQLQELQARLKALQEKAEAEQAAVNSTATALIFTKKPGVASRGFISDPPLGAHYPYRVTFDWDVNAVGPSEEFIYYSPILKTAKPFARLRSAEYYPEPNNNYAISVEVKDKSGSKAVGDFTFSTPSWVSVSGQATSTFPGVEATFFKIGEFTVYNGSSSDVLFANFETEIVDQMESTPNRNRKVSFLLKDGTTTIDSLISQTEFTFVLASPTIGQPYIAPLNLPFNVKLKPGEEKIISLWVEQMKYVRSGTLQIRVTKTAVVTDTPIVGKWNFALTREPPL